MKNYATICQFHQNCNKDLPSRNDNPFGIKGMVYQEFTSYKEAKDTQKRWVTEETYVNGVPDLRDNIIDCGDCTISVISQKEIAALYEEIEDQD